MWLIKECNSPILRKVDVILLINLLKSILFGGKTSKSAFITKKNVVMPPSTQISKVNF